MCWSSVTSLNSRSNSPETATTAPWTSTMSISAASRPGSKSDTTSNMREGRVLPATIAHLCPPERVHRPRQPSESPRLDGNDQRRHNARAVATVERPHQDQQRDPETTL